ncbi:thiamine ABC transporter ATP-binding protein [Rhodophyticola sp. SM2404]
MLKLDAVEISQGSFTLRADLELAKGGRLAVMGASGSGKSTLLNLIAGFLIPDQGRILLDGQEATQRDVAERPLSILFQDGNVFPHLNVFDNVALGVSPSLKLDAAARARIPMALAQTGLEGMEERMPADLSGGQQSRIALARVLVRDRPLVLLDEPFAALDPGLKREMAVLLDALCKKAGLTLVMVTHDLRDAEMLCEDVIVLEKGEIALNRPLAGIRENTPAALRPWL